MSVSVAIQPTSSQAVMRQILGNYISSSLIICHSCSLYGKFNNCEVPFLSTDIFIDKSLFVGVGDIDYPTFCYLFSGS